MPTIKAAVRPGEKNAQGKCNIKMRISHRRRGDKNCRVRDISTEWYIEPKYMSRSGQILASYPGAGNLNLVLAAKVQGYHDLLVRHYGNDVGLADVNDIVKIIKSDSDTGEDFFLYCQKRIEELYKQNRITTAEMLSNAIKQLRIYHKPESLRFGQLTRGFLKGFDDFLKYTTGKSQNTMHDYQTAIRTVFYHAVDNKVIKLDLSPYREYSIPKQQRKRPQALDIAGIRRLIMAYPYFTRAQQREIDVFLLMFYTGGTNYKDLVFLRHENLIQDRILFARFKTGRDYSIRIYPEAKEIIDRYKGTTHLLRFLDKKIAITADKRKNWMERDMLRNTNKLLSQAGKAVGLQLGLRTYIARYSWGTIAARIGISKDIIRQVLGHGLNTITDLYVDFDQDKCDEAISKVISAVQISFVPEGKKPV